MTTLKISNEEMEVIMKIVKSFEESGSVIKGAGETIKQKNKKLDLSHCYWVH